MKVIGFVGEIDKSDLMVYLAKIATELKYKVLIIDATSRQKMKYIVPAIEITKSYITQYEGFDVAIGFDRVDEVAKYLGNTDENYLEYDYIIVDMDADWKIEGFRLQNAYKNYFVTNYDTYSIKKGIEAISNIEERIKMCKVIFSKDIDKADDDYLNYLISDANVEWEKEEIRFPYEIGDHTAIMENQRLSRVKFKKLSVQYKDSMMMIAEQILDSSPSEIRRICKLIDKE